MANISKRLMDNKINSLSAEAFFQSNEIIHNLTEIVRGITKLYRKPVKVKVITKGSAVAYTDGTTITLNVGTPWVKAQKTLREKYYVLAGILLHETAHILYTPFKIQRETQKRLAGGEIYPAINVSPETQKILDMGKGPRLIETWHSFFNCIEDGHIEKRVLEHVPGYGECLTMVRNIQRKEDAGQTYADQIKEAKKKGYKLNKVSCLINLTLDYAKFGDKNIGNVSDELTDTFNTMALYIDKAVNTNEPEERIRTINIVFDLFVKFMYDELSKQQNMQQKQSQQSQQQSDSDQDSQEQDSSGDESSSEDNSSDDDESESEGENTSGNAGEDGQSSKSRSTTSNEEQDEDTEANGSSKEDVSESGDSDKEENSKSSSETEEDSADEQDDSAQNDESSEDSSDKGGNTSEGEDSSDEEEDNAGTGADDLSDLFDDAMDEMDSKSSNTQDDVDHSSIDNDPCDQAAEDSVKGNQPPTDSKSSLDDFPQIEREIAQHELESEALNAIERKMQRIAAQVSKKRNDNVSYSLSYIRGLSSDDHSQLDLIAKRVVKNLDKIIKDRQLGDKNTGLYSGKQLDTARTYRKDRKIFANKILPEDVPNMEVCVLVDCSGSMYGERIEAARQCAYITWKFCQLMHIPISVYGHTTYGSMDDVKLMCVSHPENLDKHDGERILNLQADDCNRDGWAIEFCCQALLESDAAKKLLLVISDGQPNAYGYDGITDCRAKVSEYLKKGVVTAVAGLAESAEQVKRVYISDEYSAKQSAKFMDFSDLSLLPRAFAQLIKKELL